MHTRYLIIAFISLFASLSLAFTSATQQQQQKHSHRQSKRASSKKITTGTKFNAGFNIKNVVSVAEQIASHSWEYGTLAEALLELYNPDYAVYSTNAFPKGVIPTASQSIRSLAYVKDKFVLGDGTLSAGNGANGDPASLGISAVLIGETNTTIEAAAASQVQHLYSAPRFYNGAISQRNDVAELWADGASMIMPYLAYYGAATQNVSMMVDAANQILLYRDVLLANTTASWNGLWVHIVGPQSQTLGIWATGNGWAALGMVRVLAALKHYSPDAGHVATHEKRLVSAMMAIFNGLTGVDHDDSTKLLRNYLIGDANSQSTHDTNWFGDASGSAALVAAALRLAVLEPSQCSYLYNATRHVRNAVINSINPTTGVASPTVDPLNWYSTTAYTSGSPEGQAFIIMMYAAWRDCVNYGCCPQPDKEPSQKNHKYSVWGGKTFTTTTTTSSSSPTAAQMAKQQQIKTTSSARVTSTAKAKEEQIVHTTTTSMISSSISSGGSHSTPAPKSKRRWDHAPHRRARQF